MAYVAGDTANLYKLLPLISITDQANGTSKLRMMLEEQDFL